MSRADTLPTMPAIRCRADAFAFARGPDRSARGQGSSRNKRTSYGRCQSASGQGRTRSRQAAAPPRGSAGGLCPAGDCARWSRPARSAGRAARTGSSPARSQTPSHQPERRRRCPSINPRRANRSPQGLAPTPGPAAWWSSRSSQRPRHPEPSQWCPVIFPGYVLPDDSLEDRAHEGS